MSLGPEREGGAGVGRPAGRAERTRDGDDQASQGKQDGAAGFLLKDAGPALLLSTVKTHITRIQDKLGIRNRVELAAWSWENRIMGSSP